MEATTHLTDEQAALLWSGDTASLANLNNSPDAQSVIDENKDDKKKLDSDDKVSDNVDTKVFTDDEIADVFAGVYKVDEEDDSKEDSSDTSKKGRKPSDLVSLINQLVTDGDLIGYEDDSEIKTIDQAKALIKDNIKNSADSAGEDYWKKKKDSYSPQVQAIIDYAEAGGTDISSLLDAIKQVEKSADLSLETEDGQKEIVKEYLRFRGMDDEDIKEQIETFEDLGKLKSKAEKFLPQLNEKKAERIQQMQEMQEKQNEELKKASEIYQQTVVNTLKKDEIGGIKYKKEERAQVFDALANFKYKSLNGGATNAFVKSLEDAQFGEKQDMEHYMNIVFLATNKEAFYNKMREKFKTEATIEEVKKLKTSKTNSANTEFDNQANGQTKGQKKMISSQFKNPFA